MRHPIRTLAPVTAALAAGLLLAGCADVEPLPEVTQGARPTAAPATETPTAATKAPAAAAAALTVGGPGTACALPVSFGVAEKWTPKAIEDPENPEFAALTRQGPATVRCEVDAKPAGHVGFLRVWTAGKGSAKAVLEGFVKAEQNTSKVTYEESGSGAGPVTEVTYTVYNKLMEESKEERAFAVSTPKGTVIVHLGGLDTAEHRAMIPAYELARSTLKPL
ncbi:MULTISPECIES: lipoprotein [unclassified Streptomyces]|uniref:lipoprotein n=1 Tax=unclassified Streptomyces TaxID=2593676 RepID=UPI001655B6A8|nr:lipoprotein [Streptomyces sp. CB02980]MCB8902869.1 lipoprotein [Streptomyces sp. CB02980]